jgi:MFS family permease
LVYYDTFIRTFPFFVQGFDGVSNAMSGWAISTLTISSAIAALFYKNMRRRFSFPTIYGISFLIMASGYLLLSQCNSYLQTLLVILWMGIGTGWLMPNSSLWIMSVVPESIRGRMVGRLTTFIFLGMFASPLFVQPLQHWFGIRGAFAFSGATMILIGFAFIFMLQEGKKQAVRPAPHPR